MYKIKGRTYVLGDLHGNYKGLIEVLIKCHFNYELDTLIFLGDLADGWGEANKCVDVFLRMNNFYFVIGNHDLFLMKWLKNGIIDNRWFNFKKTLPQFTSKRNKNKLRKILKDAKPYFILNGKMFCHGGFNPKKPLNKQKNITYSINRRLYSISKQYENQKLKINPICKKDVTHIFIGHTPTQNHRPDFKSNLINLDTGGGSCGKLTIMDVNNFEYWQSRPSRSLY